jgi:dGTPase
MPAADKKDFDAKLAPYAARHDNSLGRRHGEPAASDRNEFQRDATRITHSAAFRRLQYKTQVFSNHDGGDLFRTRLTHSLEVAQVSRSAARSLRLNEDLAETLALAHDLGHAPFGHLGQDALGDAMRDKGGFEHNLQSLRIVDELEKAYIGHPGLNLLFESREGILKHCSRNNARMLSKQAAEAGDQGLALLVNRFLPEDERKGPSYRSPSLEAQTTDWCDAIAYTHADMEDAVTMKVLTLDALADGVPLFKAAYDAVRQREGAPKPGQEPLFAKVVSGVMMKQALANLVDSSKETLEKSAVASIEDVRKSPALIGFSPEFLTQHHRPFKHFLHDQVYTHPDVEKWRGQQQAILENLFINLAENPSWVKAFDKSDKRGVDRQLCDYLASLTDYSALQEFKRVQELMSSKSARSALGRRKKP